MPQSVFDEAEKRVKASPGGGGGSSNPFDAAEASLTSGLTVPGYPKPPNPITNPLAQYGIPEEQAKAFTAAGRHETAEDIGATAGILGSVIPGGPVLRGAASGAGYLLGKTAGGETPSKREAISTMALSAGVPMVISAAASPLVRRAISKVPTVLLRRIPGFKTAESVVDFVNSVKKSEVLLPRKTRDDLAMDLYTETHGIEPKSAADRVTAIKELREALKSEKQAAAKIAKGVKPPPLQGSSLARRQAAEAEAAAAGSKPKVAPPPLQGSSLARREAEEATPAPPSKILGPTGEPAAASTSTSTARSQRYSEAAGNPGLASRELNPGKVINAQAAAKNKALAARFAKLSLTPDQVQNMTEAEYNQHRLAENVIRKQQKLPLMEAPRPGPNRRTFTELKADILREMRGGAKTAGAAGPSGHASAIASSIESGTGLPYGGGATEAVKGAPQVISSIRRANPSIPKAVFDKTLLDLADQGKIVLTTVDSIAGKTKQEIAEMVHDPQTGKYYVAAAVR